MVLPAWLKDEGDSVLLSVKVQPRASRNTVDAAPGDELRIRLTAAPVDNAANEALLKFLAGKLE